MGYNVPGELLILFALGFNLLSGFSFFRAARGNRSYGSLAQKSYKLFAAAVTLAVVYLFYLFFSHNFAIKYVFEYSDRSLPFFYLLSAFWGGQEGTYLLWLFFNALGGFLILRTGGQYRDWGMVVIAMVNSFFLVVLVELSPFALLGYGAADGAGLNPLLHDPWMVIHPPVIFVGYAMAAVPFAIAMAALIMDDYSGWLKRVFPWVAVTSVMLGAGNVMGGYWAYGTLGWGGYWSWDPVENSSFMPWLASLALLHGLIIERRSGALRKSNLLLTGFVFVLVIYGTFLTRSGVLADFSVHSFVDLGTNIYLIGFLALFVLLVLVLVARRIGSLGNVGICYNYFGREFSLVAAMALLFIFCVVVLFWTSLPLITSVFSSTPRAADRATYNSFGFPFALLYSFLLAVAPFSKYGGYHLRGWRTKLSVLAAISAAIGLGAFLLWPETGWMPAMVVALVTLGLAMYLWQPGSARSLIPGLAAAAGTVLLLLQMNVDDGKWIVFLALAAMACASNLTAAIAYLPGRWRMVGSQVAHLGFGLMLVGVLASSAFASSQKLILTKGGSGSAYGLTIRYQGMAEDIMYPKNELVLTVDDGSGPQEIRPQLYYSQRLGGIMRKPYIRRSLLEDLYFAPQHVQEPAEGENMVLGKGESKEAGGYRFTFLGFDMRSHSVDDTDMRVAARLEVADGDHIDTLIPALNMVATGAGGMRQNREPAYLGTDRQHSVSIDRILADQGAVVLSLPGLVKGVVAESLVLDVSRKPLIIFVWVGTTLILAGCIICYIRRREELGS